jgi:hypothetical protein
MENPRETKGRGKKERAASVLGKNGNKGKSTTAPKNEERKKPPSPEQTKRKKGERAKGSNVSENRHPHFQDVGRSSE